MLDTRQNRNLLTVEEVDLHTEPSHRGGPEITVLDNAHVRGDSPSERYAPVRPVRVQLHRPSEAPPCDLDVLVQEVDRRRRRLEAERTLSRVRLTPRRQTELRNKVRRRFGTLRALFELTRQQARYGDKATAHGTVIDGATWFGPTHPAAGELVVRLDVVALPPEHQRPARLVDLELMRRQQAILGTGQITTPAYSADPWSGQALWSNSLVGKSLSNARVRAAAPDDRVPQSYFVFADGRLLRVGTGSTEAELVAEVPDIGEVGHGTGDGRPAGKELEIGLYVHGPWVCVTERFGVNASLVNTATGAVRGLSRADYHSDVSSYSIGFLDRDGRTLLVAQTQWNRLDVFDAETGTNLTGREVFIRDSGRRDEQRRKIYDRSNYVDYFHSLLHVSPDSRHFLSNGWVWSPVDVVRIFSTEAFLTGYEPTGISVATVFGYNWDRPCAFIDDRTFVLALDDGVDTLDPAETANYRYRQLGFFKIPDRSSAGHADQWLEPSSLVECEVFPRNEYGEVKGELHYDPESGCLVALTNRDGCFVVSLAGDIVARVPDLSLASPPSHGDFGSRYSGSRGWSYAPQHRVFYRWLDGAGIEERAVPAARQLA